MTAATPRLVGVAAITTAFVTVAWRVLTFSGFSNDHYVHVARAQQMLLGEWPIRDFVDPGLPLMYVASALARRVAGPALGTELALVAGGLAIAAALTVVAATRLSGSVFIATVVSLLGVLINPRTYSYPKLFFYAVLAVVLCRAANSVSRRRVIGLAVLTAIAFLFRHDHGVFIGFASTIFILVHQAPSGRHAVVSRLGLFAAITALLLVPWAVYVSTLLGLGSYVASAVQFAGEENRANILRALPTIDWSEGWASAPNGVAWLFYLCHGLPLAALAVLVRRRRLGVDAWPGETSAVVALALMAIPLNVSFLRDTLSARVADAVVPASLLGAWLAGLAFRRPWTAMRVTGAAAVFVLMAVTTQAVLLAGDFRGHRDRAHLASGPRAIAGRIVDLTRRLAKPLPEGDQVPSRQAAALMPFVAFLQRCTTPADRVLITSLRAEIYVLANRGFAGGHVSYAPGFYGSDAEQALTIARLRRQSVPFVVRLEEVERELAESLPRVMAYLDEHYSPVAQIEVFDAPPAQLYFARGRPAPRTDEATGWPCPALGEPVER